MAMIGYKDKPTYYNIVNDHKVVVAVAPKSKVLRTRAKLEKELGRKLDIELAKHERLTGHDKD